jgi:DNA-binding response OmpR family regulator
MPCGRGELVKVLVAEDSSTVRHLLVGRLAADGYQVIEAADGEEALALVREEGPDLLVLDKVMPGYDGFEVVRALREDPLTRAIPVVMLTERASEDDVLSGLRLGVEEYMPKPFSPRELSARVQRVLARAGRAQGPR